MVFLTGVVQLAPVVSRVKPIYRYLLSPMSFQEGTLGGTLGRALQELIKYIGSISGLQYIYGLYKVVGLRVPSSGPSQRRVVQGRASTAPDLG